MFAIVRIGLGLWSFFVPVLAAQTFVTLAWILTGFVVVSGLIGVIWGPRNEGKSLEQIEAERTTGLMQEPNPALAPAELQSVSKQTLT
jgi:inositol transporter-like SP family MFS transporter